MEGPHFTETAMSNELTWPQFFGIVFVVFVLCRFWCKFLGGL